MTLVHPGGCLTSAPIIFMSFVSICVSWTGCHRRSCSVFKWTNRGGSLIKWHSRAERDRNSLRNERAQHVAARQQPWQIDMMCGVRCGGAGRGGAIYKDALQQEKVAWCLFSLRVVVSTRFFHLFLLSNVELKLPPKYTKGISFIYYFLCFI